MEALEQFCTLFQVSCRGVSQVKDRRGENLMLLTMPPVVVLFEEGKDRVIESMRRNGVMVVPNQSPLIVAQVPGRSIDGALLVKILKEV